ncbi:hypothetical protein V2H77_01015 [Photorhabdus sp. P32]|uniref:hypothetical protein n=1 Tax=Photorhabdus sp. P32 TaxID=3117549 RepID=UPI00311B10BF
MSNIFLFDNPLLPKGFKLPAEYVSLAERCIAIDLEPWTFLYNDMATSLSYYGAMLIKYKDKPLIPFAMVNDQSGFYNDGYIILACFDGHDLNGDPKIYLHDYSNISKEISWNERYYLENFSAWLELAKEESARYKAERAEEE